jgi:Bifunctional DNA primase/polymerase, N-terminal
MIEHALKYARLRIPVIPIWTMVRRNGRIACACGRPCGRDAGKHPLGHLVSNGALDATTDPETIKRWWAKWPDANVGIRLGSFMPWTSIRAMAEIAPLPRSRTHTAYCRQRDE